MGVKDETVSFDDFVIGGNDDLNIDTPPPVVQDEEKDEKVTDDVDDKSDDKTKTPGDDQDDSQDDNQDDEDISDENQDDESDDDDDDSDDDNQDDDDNNDDVDDTFVPLIEAMHEHNGWEFDEEKFKDGSMDGLMDFITEVVEANSKPEYASEDTARFDDFVRKYGPEKASEFLNVNFGPKNYEEIDLSEDSNKEELMRDYLKATTKFSPEKIERQVKKASEMGDLDDEEELDDMKSFLVEDAEKNKKAFEEQAEREREIAYKNHVEYLDTQKQRIIEAEEIAGFKPSKKEKEAMYEWAYKVGKDGMTGYQRAREASKDMDIELLWHAYKGLKKGSITKLAQSEQAKELKKKMSRYTDKNSKRKGSGAKTPRKVNPSKDTDYNDFVLR